MGCVRASSAELVITESNAVKRGASGIGWLMLLYSTVSAVLHWTAGMHELVKGPPPIKKTTSICMGSIYQDPLFLETPGFRVGGGVQTGT